jgi:hypothetical protein
MHELWGVLHPLQWRCHKRRCYCLPVCIAHSHPCSRGCLSIHQLSQALTQFHGMELAGTVDRPRATFTVHCQQNLFEMALACSTLLSTGSWDVTAWTVTLECQNIY